MNGEAYPWSRAMPTLDAWEGEPRKDRSFVLIALYVLSVAGSIGLVAWMW